MLTRYFLLYISNIKIAMHSNAVQNLTVIKRYKKIISQWNCFEILKFQKGLAIL